MTMRQRLEEEKVFIGLAIFLLLFAVVYMNLPRDASGDGIVQGRVLIGPTCPVVVEGGGCEDRPYQATIVVRPANGFGEVARVRSDANGEFGLRLRAGTYILEPQAGSSQFEYASPVTVVVEEGQVVNITIVYDSGIR